MKQLIKVRVKAILLLFLVSFYQTIALAQDSTSTTTKTTTSSSTETNTWYTEPWVWVVGGAVFLIILVVLLRGNSSKAGSTDKVTVTKTVSRDSDSA